MLCDSTYCLQANTCAKRVSKKREWQRGLFGPKNARANGKLEVRIGLRREFVGGFAGLGQKTSTRLIEAAGIRGR